MTSYGYARVSTQSQHVEQQIEWLTRHGVEPAFIETEKISGRKDRADREALVRLLKELKDGDELWVINLDRLGRNAQDLLLLRDELADKKVVLHVGDLTIHNDTMGKMFFALLAMMAEFEANIIVERTVRRLTYMKANKIPIGRRSQYSPEQARLMLKMLEEDNYSVREIARVLWNDDRKKSSVQRAIDAARDERDFQKGDMDPELRRKVRSGMSEAAKVRMTRVNKKREKELLELQAKQQAILAAKKAEKEKKAGHDAAGTVAQMSTEVK